MFKVDRSDGFPVDWTQSPANLREAIEEGARRLLEWTSPPPCGTKKNPHIVHPNVAAGKSIGRCVNCGEVCGGLSSR